MRRGRWLLSLAGVLLALVAFSGCESGPTEEELKAAQTAEAWAAIEQAKAELDAKRQELAELRAQISGEGAEGEGAEGEGAEGEGAGAEGVEGEEATEPVNPEELAAQAEALQQQVYDLTDSFGASLAQFINDQGISVGGELTEVQTQAIHMKTDEDMLLAREYIDKGGEYQRALDIYAQAQMLDPDNETLAAAIAEAEALRYMTEERLAEVKKNMTEDEVRALLGTPKVQNVREFDAGVIGWFYPKEEPNTAAAVFFRERKGVLKVYKTDFEAVKAGDAQDAS